VSPEAEKLTAAQQRVVKTLTDKGPTSLRALCDAAGVGASTVASLAKKHLVEIYDETVRRDPLAHAANLKREAFTLTPSQSTVLEVIESQIAGASYSAFLLHGVTGSGKTEVYIRAMRSALNLGRSSMMLVPEIALTPVFSRRLRAEFGDQVAIFHSSLQKGERFDEWTRVKNGDARIVIGTRSAVFAPVRKLGLIVVDEEHESSYRQQESPYYNARDTAIVRAQKESATVVLGSATPSLESFYNARHGKYALLALPERIGARPMASATMIDMRNVFARHGKPRVFSDELLEAIRDTHARNEQVDHSAQPARLFAIHSLSLVRRNEFSVPTVTSPNVPPQRASDRLSLLQSPATGARRLSCMWEEVHLLRRRRHRAIGRDADAILPHFARCSYRSRHHCASNSV
jgi:primosomal protein N' (replication factor Y)